MKTVWDDSPVDLPVPPAGHLWRRQPGQELPPDVRGHRLARRDRGQRIAHAPVADELHGHSRRRRARRSRRLPSCSTTRDLGRRPRGGPAARPGRRHRSARRRSRRPLADAGPDGHARPSGPGPAGPGLAGGRNSKQTWHSVLRAYRNALDALDGWRDVPADGRRRALRRPRIEARRQLRATARPAAVLRGPCRHRRPAATAPAAAPSRRTGPRGSARRSALSCGAGADVIKICITGGIAGEHEQIRDSQATYAEMEAACEAAHNAGRKITAHAGSAAPSPRASRPGSTASSTATSWTSRPSS